MASLNIRPQENLISQMMRAIGILFYYSPTKRTGHKQTIPIMMIYHKLKNYPFESHDKTDDLFSSKFKQQRMQQKAHAGPFFSIQDDRDFADDLALLSHTHSHFQEKTVKLQLFGQQVRLQISTNKQEH